MNETTSDRPSDVYGMASVLDARLNALNGRMAGVLHSLAVQNEKEPDPAQVEVPGPNSLTGLMSCLIDKLEQAIAKAELIESHVGFGQGQVAA